MNNYNDLLLYFKNLNYKFINFKDFFSKEDKTEKLILLRHDVHARDINNAYNMIQIEKEILGECKSTFFVQWNFIGNSKYEQNNENINKDKYYKFIKYCIKHNINVEPHISVFAEYFKNVYNRDNKILEGIINKNKFIDNYKYDYINNKFCLKIINKDIFDIGKIKKYLIKYFKKYNEEWKNTFGHYPKFYSAHGDSSFLNKYFNGNSFLSLIEKECKIISGNSRNILIGNKSLYKFGYFSDCASNKMNELINRINNSQKFSLLIHPNEWNTNINVFICYFYFESNQQNLFRCIDSFLNIKTKNKIEKTNIKINLIITKWKPTLIKIKKYLKKKYISEKINFLTILDKKNLYKQLYFEKINEKLISLKNKNIFICSSNYIFDHNYISDIKNLENIINKKNNILLNNKIVLNND